jgi:hypothetical protein
LLSSYWLDTLAPATNYPEGEPVDTKRPTAAALESHLYALMAAQDYRVIEVYVARREGLAVPPPEGWVIIRATAVVEEFEVDVELDDGGLDDPAEVFDVELEVGLGLEDWLDRYRDQ